jgi:hypothetical protein
MSLSRSEVFDTDEIGVVMTSPPMMPDGNVFEDEPSDERATSRTVQESAVRPFYTGLNKAIRPFTTTLATVRLMTIEEAPLSYEIAHMPAYYIAEPFRVLFGFLE